MVNPWIWVRASGNGRRFVLFWYTPTRLTGLKVVRYAITQPSSRCGGVCSNSFSCSDAEAQNALSPRTAHVPCKHSAVGTSKQPPQAPSPRSSGDGETGGRTKREGGA